MLQFRSKAENVIVDSNVVYSEGRLYFRPEFARKQTCEYRHLGPGMYPKSISVQLIKADEVKKADDLELVLFTSYKNNVESYKWHVSCMIDTNGNKRCCYPVVASDHRMNVVWDASMAWNVKCDEDVKQLASVRYWCPFNQSLKLKQFYESKDNMISYKGCYRNVHVRDMIVSNPVVWAYSELYPNLSSLSSVSMSLHLNMMNQLVYNSKLGCPMDNLTVQLLNGIDGNCYKFLVKVDYWKFHSVAVK